MIIFLMYNENSSTVRPVLNGHSKRRPNFGLQYRLSVNAGRKYCRMLHGEHSVILLTFIKLPFSIKTLVWSIFKWPLKTGFVVYSFLQSTNEI